MSDELAIDLEAKRIEQLEQEYEELNRELSQIRIREDEILVKKEKVEEEVRSLKQVVELPTLREQWKQKTESVKSLADEMREEDADWDYDNNKNNEIS